MISGYQDGGALAYAAAENLKRATQEAVWQDGGALAHLAAENLKRAKQKAELIEFRNNFIKKEIDKIKGCIPDLSSKPTERETKPQKRLEIDSPAFDRLMQAIEAFPVEHPDYETKPPKQLVVISWLNSKFVFSDKDRESRFIDKVIVEHFKLPR